MFCSDGLDGGIGESLRPLLRLQTAARHSPADLHRTNAVLSGTELDQTIEDATRMVKPSPID